MVERAELLSIDPGALTALADDLHRHWPDIEALVAGAAVPADGAGTEVEVEVERTAAEVITANAINFGSGYHDVVNKDEGLSGARTMAARWGRHLELAWAEYAAAPGALARYLTELSTDDCAAIFGQDSGHDEQRELMALFAQALADLGAAVLDATGGRFAAFVEAADRSGQGLAETLGQTPFYADEALIDGHRVVFHKRSQITVADLGRALPHWGPAQFTDLDQLTAFADNLVPHVLRVDGVLRYPPDLAATIDGGVRLEWGSRAEIEIRAHGVEGVEQLTSALRSRGRPARAMDVDLALWTRGGLPHYKAVPRHRARCVYY